MTVKGLSLVCTCCDPKNGMFAGCAIAAPAASAAGGLSPGLTSSMFRCVLLIERVITRPSRLVAGDHAGWRGMCWKFRYASSLYTASHSRACNELLGCLHLYRVQDHRGACAHPLSSDTISSRATMITRSCVRLNPVNRQFAYARHAFCWAMNIYLEPQLRAKPPHHVQPSLPLRRKH